MHRFAKVSTRLWEDSKFKALSPLAPSGQALWLLLLTTSHRTIVPGVILAGPATLAEQVGWTTEALSNALAELVRIGFAEVDERARLVWLPKAVEHNPPSSPNHVKAWVAALGELPECPLLDRVIASLSESFTRGLPFGEVFRKLIRTSYRSSSGSSSERATRFNRSRQIDGSSLRSLPSVAETSLSPRVGPLARFLAEHLPEVKQPASFEAKMLAAYPALDLLDETRRAVAWMAANPNRPKKQPARFLQGWYDRAHRDQKAHPPAASAAATTPARWWAFLKPEQAAAYCAERDAIAPCLAGAPLGLSDVPANPDRPNGKWTTDPRLVALNDRYRSTVEQALAQPSTQH